MNEYGQNKAATRRIALALAAAVVAASLLQPAQQAQAAQHGYKLIEQAIDVDGARSSLSALNMDNTTYIAIRALNDAIGLTTDWDKASGTVTVTGRDRELALNLQDGSANLNGQRIYGLPAVVRNNTTYVPFRFLLERMGYGVSYDSATKTIGIETIEENELKISTARIQESEKNKSLTIHYPQISGFANEAVQKKINETLKTDAELNAEVARRTLSDSLGDGDFGYSVSFEGTYTVTYNADGKLSLYVDYYTYSGGAHGSTARATYTFDLATGKLLTLKDAAGGNERYVAIINDKIQSQIKARRLTLLNPFRTIEPNRDFFLKPSGIVVFFTEYEYTPYAAGMPEFEIPYSEFE
ncbi:stalk domain-containing protein [Paenibacillaceae bacterium WGS1546]|uniref:stalk domain-containing protein n=1 Tax=Cohnella sp. WGS1546 TaxID=3366810 RepID=UPI00372D2CCB